MFRAKFINEIRRILDSSRFSAADFSMKTGREPLLLLDFIPDPKFTFRVDEASNPIGLGGIQYKVSNSPGLYWANEERFITDIDDVLDCINRWVTYLYEDLKCISPVYDELEMLRAKLEEHVQSSIEEPDQMFSPEEIQRIVEKLGDLEERILKMEEESKISKSQSAEAQADIQKIITGAHDLPKGIWYKTACTKVWKIITGVSSSKEGRMVLTQVAQKALGVDTNTP